MADIVLHVWMPASWQQCVGPACCCKRARHLVRLYAVWPVLLTSRTLKLAFACFISWSTLHTAPRPAGHGSRALEHADCACSVLSRISTTAHAGCADGQADVPFTGALASLQVPSCKRISSIESCNVQARDQRRGCSPQEPQARPLRVQARRPLRARRAVWPLCRAAIVL